MQQISIQISAVVDFSKIHDGEDRGQAKAWATLMDMAIDMGKMLIEQSGPGSVDAATTQGAATVVALNLAKFLTERAAKELKRIGERWPLAISVRENGELNA